MKIGYIIAGHISLILGVIGIPTPLLPTTPFLLLAAFFYSKGSKKIHNWLLNHPRLGPPIEQWNKNGAISQKSKIIATILILINVSFPVFLIDLDPVIRIISGICGVGVILFILTRPTA